MPSRWDTNSQTVNNSTSRWSLPPEEERITQSAKDTRIGGGSMVPPSQLPAIQYLNDVYNTPFGLLQNVVRPVGNIISRVARGEVGQIILGTDEVGQLSFRDIWDQEWSESGNQMQTILNEFPGIGLMIPGEANTAERSRESYVHVLNRWILGDPRPQETRPGSFNPIVNLPIMATGIAMDVFIDPLWLIGRVGRLGTAGEELQKIGNIFDELGIAREPEARTLEALTDALERQRPQRGATNLRFMSADEIDNFYQRNPEALKEIMERPIIMEPGSPQYRYLENIQNKNGSLFIPVTMADQARMGLRGLFSVPVMRTTPTPTVFSRVMGGKLGMEMVAVGGNASVKIGNMELGLEPGLRYLENKYGVTDPWSFTDMLLGGDRATRDIRRAVEEYQTAGMRGIRQAQYDMLHGILDRNQGMRELFQTLWVTSGAKSRGENFDEFVRRGFATINTYAEQSRAELQMPTIVDMYEYQDYRVNVPRQEVIEYEQRIGERSPNQGAGVWQDMRQWQASRRTVPEEMPLFGEPVVREEFIQPEMQTRRVFVSETPSRTVDPLEIADLGDFADPRIHELITDIREAQPVMLSNEAAALLKTTELQGNTITRRVGDIPTIDIFSNLDELNAEDAAAYLYHMVRPDTWDELAKRGWIERDRQTNRWQRTNVGRRVLNPSSSTTLTREQRGTIEGFNNYMREKYGFTDFFEPNPALRESYRQYESRRRIIGSRYWLGLSEWLYNHQDEAGQYIYRLAEGMEPADGMMRLSDVLNRKTPNVFDAFDNTGKSILSGVQVPQSLELMLTRKASLLNNPEYLGGFMRYMKLSTDWWKTNVLGIFPSYHLGNFISNIYLNWLGGMNDPLMYALAGKIQSGSDGVVKSWWTGTEYSYEQIRAMSASYGINTGFFRGNVENLMKPGSGILDYDWSKPTGWISASTGISPKLATQTWGEYIAGMHWAPGGNEFIGNRVGFAVGGKVEENARLAMFLHSMLNEGMDAESAALRTTRALFDYTKRTASQQAMSTVFPFYEFTLQNSIFHLMKALDEPAKIAIPYRMIQSTIPAIASQDIDYSGVPSYFRNRGLIPLGSDRYIDITRFIPAFNIPDLLDNPPEAIAGFVNPALRILGSMFLKTGDSGGVTGLDMPMGVGSGTAGGYDLYRHRPLVTRPGEQEQYKYGPFSFELDPRTNYVLESVFRVVAEAKRNDLLRTLTGGRIYTEDVPTQYYYALKENAIEMEAARRNLNEPIKYDRELSDEQVRTRMLDLYSLSSERLRYLSDQYSHATLPFGEGQIQPYSRDTSDTTLYSILSEMDNLIAGTEDNRHYGLLYLSGAIRDQDMESSLWSAYEEILQKRVTLLTAMADTSLQGEGELSEDSRNEARNYYQMALNNVEEAMTVPGAGMIWKSAHFNMYLDILTHEAVSGLTPRARERAQNFARKYQDVYSFWTDQYFQDE